MALDMRLGPDSSGRKPSDISTVSPRKPSSATYNPIFNETTAKKTADTATLEVFGSICWTTLRWPSHCRESLTIGPVRNWVRSSSNPPLVIGSPHLALLSGLLTSKFQPPRGSGMTEEMLEIVIYCCRRFASPMMESYNIAIIGADGVGKSSLVQRALDLACPPATNPSSVRMAVDNVTHMVTLFELELEHFELDPCRPIQWPKQVNGHIVPRLDAALVLYDVMSRNSIRELPQMVVLGACNCDHPEDEWDINTDELANEPFFKSFVNHFRISTHGADVSRACLYSVIVLTTLPIDVNGDETVSRRRAQSAINLQVSDPNGGRRLSEHSRHSLASSDFSIQHGDDSKAEKPQIAGVAFKDLVDRLLAPPLSRVDNNFSDIFLCLYRKFAAPNELFSEIQVRLQKVQHDESANYLIKTATQLRIVEVVSKWVSSYPGDFARSGTKGNLEDFIGNLSKEPIFMFAAQQLRRNFQSDVIEDDDTGWANSDSSLDETGNNSLSEEMEELSAEVSSLQLDGESTMLPGGSDKSSSMDRSSRMGSQFPFNTSEEYEREAMLLEPSDHLPMNKLRYHSFMDISDYEVADELTRIDWIMFSSIRIRDFVRHVSLSAAQRNKCRSLRNVNRMISHFNHVAKWVANMILLRDKAKHRAQMLEKFMNIALRLRQLNNYNGLAAVLAGINGTAIHRLTQTRALVSSEVQKRFARLLILMGTQKSHFAYRLAWENSPLPRIPFIPLHRRDLVTAEEGSKTIIGSNDDRINWKKFEVLGEILLPIMKSQGTAYPNLTKHNVARELILGCRMPMDDEEIYQRSLQVESSALVPIEPIKKKFPWFAI
ncbi:hypothetical protein E4U52_003000 [Claviceps spartinae]|nr:hypothetical protein E4U52_003000 [Claviceps spartinae]